jgi:hypothetical protein
MTRLFAAFAVLLAASGAGPCLAQDAPAAPAPAPASGAAAAQPDPDSLALARDIIEHAFPPERRPALLSRTADTIMAQVRAATAAATGGNLDAGVQEIVERFVARARAETDRAINAGSPALFDAFARAYARLFTHDELVQIRDFVATPAGAKYIQRSPDLLADPDVARANTAYMTNVINLLQPLQAQLRQELIAYGQHHRR